MRTASTLGLAVAILLACFTSPLRTSSAQDGSAKELAGLWEAKKRFGPEARGTLSISQTGANWQAEIAGRFAPVKLEGDSLSFELADGKGKFRGRFDARRTKIVGHWTQPPTIQIGNRFASPVILSKHRQNLWRGQVTPLDDTMTVYLMVRPRDNGTVGVFIRNPERNLGRLARVDRLERDGETVKLFAADSTTEKGRMVAEGCYHPEEKLLSIFFPRVTGFATPLGNFDFRRVEPAEASDFYPRGRPNTVYRYAPPIQVDDGWPTASLEDVGISRAGIEKFIQMIVSTPMDSVSAQEMHGVLIARHGKLVLEEYFHGEHREKPHDTRSASKSLTATLFGAAVNARIPVNVSSPVYQVMNGGAFPADLEPRKRALTVEHLLTMSSGLDCDDGDPNSKGGEDALQSQRDEPDYYKYTLALKMVRDPGHTALYCAASSNLVAGILKRASGQSLAVLFQDLFAEPLQIQHYYLNLTPAGDPYMGGGIRFQPRDFMKLGQLHLNGGAWNGRRILTPEWAKRSTSHLVNVAKQLTYNSQANQFVAGTRMYGYQWWIEEYPYHGRTVQAFLAGGNGGQIVIGIPELDLLIAFYGGNYNDRVLLIPQWVYVPQHILPAVTPSK